MNPRHRIFLLLSLSSFLLFVLGQIGCMGDSNGPKEGIITYDITYPKPAADAFVQKMMPNEMTMKFKNDKVLTSLKFTMGLVKINYLADNENKTLTELTKLMKRKLAYVYTPKNLDYLLKDFPPYTIEKLEKEDKVIATYNCKKAIVHIKGDNPYDFTVYYTDEIQIKDPNWYSPFKELDGVMMEYQVEQYNIIMRFTAKTVELIEQEDTDFMVPEDFKMSSQKDLDEIHKSLEEMNQP